MFLELVTILDTRFSRPFNRARTLVAGILGIVVWVRGDARIRTAHATSHRPPWAAAEGCRRRPSARGRLGVPSWMVSVLAVAYTSCMKTPMALNSATMSAEEGGLQLYLHAGLRRTCCETRGKL